MWALKPIVRGLIAPRKSKELVYDNIVKELDTHYTHSVNVILERLKFYDFEKPPNQSVKELAKLRELARNTRIQQRLLAEHDLTFDKATEISLSI